MHECDIALFKMSCPPREDVFQEELHTWFNGAPSLMDVGTSRPAGNAGVGPVTAARLVQQHGDSVMEVLDSKGAAAALARVSGVGATQASRIKLAWDASRGARLGLLHFPCLQLYAARRHRCHRPML